MLYIVNLPYIRETLTKGKFDEVGKSYLNHQTKNFNIKVSNISTSIKLIICTVSQRISF